MKANDTCIEFGIGTSTGHQSTLMRNSVDKVNLSYVRKDETFVRQMHVMYSPVEEELAELLLGFFPDILSQEVLLEGYGLD
eukprot:2298902-Ditylum_brightwellii.AAC.1